jgi:hypothetical protein
MAWASRLDGAADGLGGSAGRPASLWSALAPATVLLAHGAGAAFSDAQYVHGGYRQRIG